MFLRSSHFSRIPLCGIIAGAAALGCVALMSTAAKADTVILYSTQGDFITGTASSNFGGNAGSAATSTAPAVPTVSTVATASSPTEGGTVNGIVNSTPGATGVAGSLAITLPNGMGNTSVPNYEVVASTSANDIGTFTGTGASATLAPSALVNALDAGGTVTLQYTVPTGTTYLNPPQFLISYPSNYDQLSGTASATADTNGFYTDTVSLASVKNIAQAELASFQTNGYGYLSVGIIYNGQLPIGAVSNIANIEVQTPVPEPTTIALFVMAGAGLLLIGRRRKSA